MPSVLNTLKIFSKGSCNIVINFVFFIHTQKLRLQPTHSENPTGSPTVIHTTVPPGLSVSVPAPSSALHQSGQVKDSVIQLRDDSVPPLSSAFHQSGQVKDSVIQG